jgi:hypothetical protein
VLGEVAAWRAACTTTERFWINTIQVTLVR